MSGAGAANALEIAEEEKFVLADRATDTTAEDVIPDHGLSGGDQLIAGYLARAQRLGVLLERVQFVVLQIIIAVAVKLIGAGFGEDVDEGSSRAAVLGRVGVAFPA